MITMDDWQDYQAVRNDIAAIMDRRFYTIEWLDAEIWAGRARAWFSKGAAIVAAFKVFPTGAREVEGLVAVGDLDEIAPLIRRAEVWGLSLGCGTASISSREGWARVLSGEGYAPYQLTIRKDL